MKLLTRITIALLVIDLLICAAITFAGPPWQEKIFSSLPFAVLQGLLILPVAVCILIRPRHWTRRCGALLLHLGLILIALGGLLTYTLGRKGQLSLIEGQTTNRYAVAPHETDRFQDLGFQLTLDCLDVRTYPRSHMWRSITSHLHVTDETGTRPASTSINNPLTYRGWRIYLIDFHQEPGMSTVVYFLVTREHGYPFVYAGGACVVLGLVIGLFRSPQHDPREVNPA